MLYKRYKDAILTIGMILFSVLEHAIDDEDITFKEYMSLEELACEQFSIEHEV